MTEETWLTIVSPVDAEDEWLCAAAGDEVRALISPYWQAPGQDEPGADGCWRLIRFPLAPLTRDMTVAPDAFESMSEELRAIIGSVGQPELALEA